MINKAKRCDNGCKDYKIKFDPEGYIHLFMYQVTNLSDINSQSIFV